MTHGTHDALDDPRNAAVLIYVNGDLVPRDQARVSVFDSGFMLGDGVWEGLRLYDGRVFKYEDHLDRLWKSAAMLGYAGMPTREHVTEQLRRTLAANAMTDGVHVLVETAQHPEPGTDDARQLRRPQDEWEGAEVPIEADWVELRPALETVYPEDMTVLCQRATRHRLPGPPSWCANAWHALVHLAGQNAGPEGVPPSMAFLSLLEDQLDDQVANLIRRRNQRLAGQQGLTRQLDQIRADLKKGAEEPTDSTAYLVIQVEPRLDPDGDEDAYTLASFRQWHGGDMLHSRQGEPRQVRRHQLEREVEREVVRAMVLLRARSLARS